MKNRERDTLIRYPTKVNPTIVQNLLIAHENTPSRAEQIARRCGKRSPESVKSPKIFDDSTARQGQDERERMRGRFSDEKHTAEKRGPVRA